MQTIENWSIVTNGFTPPEAGFTIAGIFPDGKKWVTSQVQSSVGSVIRTRNSEYRLGKPNKDYVMWCKANGFYIPTKERPFKTDFPFEV